MNERLKFEGKLSVNEKEANSLRIQIEGLRDSIRDVLDPIEDIDELDIERAVEEVMQMANKVLKYKEIKGKIKALEKALGRA